MVSLLTAGDPLADAAVAELDLLGPQAWRALDTGLRHGVAGLDGRSPEAVGALLRHLETTPARIDPLLLHRGDVVSLSVPPLWFSLCSITSALAHTYASPAVAQLLTRTGGSADMATHRLVETWVWARQIIRPGGLLRGGPGYVATVQLRLRHARMRATALKDWDTGVRGMPIGRLDLTRTWLGFTLFAFRALSAVGIDITPDEERRLYQYWSYVAHLLGIDESLCEDATDHDGARLLQERLDALMSAPDENSRALTAAMIDAQARAMAAAPGAVLSEEQLRAITRSVLRQTFGDEQGDRLGVTVPPPTDLMPLVGSLNREARYWQTYSPASAGAARRRALTGPEPEPITAVIPGAAAQRPRRTAGHSGLSAA